MLSHSLLVTALLALGPGKVGKAGKPTVPAGVEQQVPAEAAQPGTAGTAEAELSPEAQKAAFLAEVAKFEAELNKRQGPVLIGDGLAAMDVSDKFNYVGPDDAQKILTQIWGNPPGAKPLGMLLPSNRKLSEPEGSWAVVISYNDEGHVKDDDAADIDFDELLEDMQADVEAQNPARREAGYGEVKLHGWAEPPHYDGKSKKLYWAKDLEFDNSGDRTLNYSIRVLGRRGVLELNAVAGMNQLPEVRAPMEEVLGFTRFEPGHTYGEFNPSTDQVAAYGIGGLIAGKVLAKAGFFKAIFAALLAAKKLVIVALAAIGAFVARMFGRKKADEVDDV